MPRVTRAIGRSNHAASCGVLALAILFIGTAAPDLVAAPLTTTCPDPYTVENRVFSIGSLYGDPLGTAECAVHGVGNEQNSAVFNDYLAAHNFVLLDEDVSSNQFDSWLSATNVDRSAGTFTIHANAWDSYNRLLLVFKSGVAQRDPDWAAFLFTPEVLGGNWQIDPATQGGALSHVRLYGTNVSVVPEPTSLLLLGSGVIGVVAARRRSRTRTTVSASRR